MTLVADLVVVGASEVLTMAGPSTPLGTTGAGGAEARLGRIPKGAVAAHSGRIVWVGPERELGDSVVLGPDAARIDARGGTVLPGLVDCHTHLVFAGDRSTEFARKMAGESYQSIAASGGGIMSSVRATRAATEEALLALASERALRLRSHGVTTVECKSGYGLELEAELRCLRVGRRLGEIGAHPEREGTPPAYGGIVRTTTTFLGAHVVPAEHRSDRARYVDEICERMIPAVASEGLADACDVYLDEGAFDHDEARRILSTARHAGLALRLHAGQFRDLGGGELAAELGALSADHLEALTDTGLAAMSRAGVVGVLLPGAWRTLRQTPPDASRFRAAGLAMAIATDCNPGTSPTTDPWLCAALAVRDAGLTLEEALLGVTIEAARAAGLPDRGALRPGALADLAVFPHADARALPYWLGDVHASHVVLGGRPISGA